MYAPRVQRCFEEAIARVEEQEPWQIARLGVSYISNSHQYVGKVLLAGTLFY
jgi:uncharacterized protein YlxP (DUF503 family)